VVRVKSSGLAIRSQVLYRALEQFQSKRVHLIDTIEGLPETTWRIIANNDNTLADRQQINAGSRSMLACEVSYANLDSDQYYVESVSEGWLMLLPLSSNRAVLQCMLPGISRASQRLSNMLKDSILIAPAVHDLGETKLFTAAPYTMLPMAGNDWLAIGENCARMDPISGEGSPFAIRCGLLAAAVVADVVMGRVDANAARKHYADRIAISMLAHLEGSKAFYSEAFGTHMGWKEELRQTAQAYLQIQQLSQAPEAEDLAFSLGLNGLEAC
jgi:hypothetical protein